MPAKTAYSVTLRRKDTGEEQTRRVLSYTPGAASEHAKKRAREELKPMVDRLYAQFEVVSCVAAPARV